MGISQSKKRSAVDAELDEAVDITANEPATADMIDLNIATAVPAASLGLEALSTAAIAEEARAMYEQVVVTIDLSTPSAAAAAASTDDEAAEQPIAVGNAAYLLTFLGFLAWLLNESGGKDKYCKTAVTRIAEFLTFIGKQKTSARLVSSLTLRGPLAGFPTEATHLQLIHALLNVEPVDIEKFVEHLDKIRLLSPSTVRSFAAWYNLSVLLEYNHPHAKVYNTLGNLKEGHIWVTLHFDCRAVYSPEASQLYRMVEVRLKSLQRTYRKLRNAVNQCSASFATCLFKSCDNRRKLTPT
jgi:hypothetical protein